jgi:hypothetical protein
MCTLKGFFLRKMLNAEAAPRANPSFVARPSVAVASAVTFDVWSDKEEFFFLNRLIIDGSNPFSPIYPPVRSPRPGRSSPRVSRSLIGSSTYSQLPLSELTPPPAFEGRILSSSKPKSTRLRSLAAPDAAFAPL